jgi:site-specific DNA recombinase
LASSGAKRLYLLRGLARCSICGSTYVGTAYPDDRVGRKVYSVCGGQNSGRGTAALQYRRCPSKAIRGDIEEEVWNDIEGFLRHPASGSGEA